MAKKHKAPTQVTLVKEEKAPFAQWVESNWRMGAVLAVVATAVILGSQYLRQQKTAGVSEEWEGLRSARLAGDASEVERAASSLPALQADWAYLVASQIRVSERDYDAALANLDLIKGENPLFSKLRLPYGQDGETLTVIDAARQAIEAQMAHDEALADKLHNPDPPADGPRVLLDTSLGPITIALYAEQAPLHVENFLARVEEEYYTDLKFHRVEKGRIVWTGDPNTREGDATTWGLGGPDERVESESDNGLIHDEYVVGMARSGIDPESSGSQFYVTLSRQHQRDGEYTVFGVVQGEDSVATLKAIEEVPLEGTRPVTAPILRSVTRL